MGADYELRDLRQFDLAQHRPNHRRTVFPCRNICRDSRGGTTTFRFQEDHSLSGGLLVGIFAATRGAGPPHFASKKITVYREGFGFPRLRVHPAGAPIPEDSM